MVTSDPASTVVTRITANTVAAAAAVLATNREGTAPRAEGRTTATLLSSSLIVMRCNMSLHSSSMGGGAILNPISI